MCDARLFQAQITAMSHDRAVTIAPVTGGKRIEEIASGLLDQLPHRFALCGFGLGGSIALEIVRRAPERVTQLCLITAEVQADTPQIAADREELIIGAQAGRLDDVMRRVIGSDMLAPRTATNSDSRRCIADGRGVGAGCICATDAYVAAASGSARHVATDQYADRDHVRCS